MRGLGTLAAVAILFAVGGCGRPAPPALPLVPQPVFEPTSEAAQQPHYQHQIPLQPQPPLEDHPPRTEPDPDLEIPSIERVRSMLYRPGCGSNRIVGVLSSSEETIIRWGARAFPAYEAILADPAADVWDVVGTCDALHQVKADRRRFIPLLVQRLVAHDALVQLGVTRAWGDDFDEGSAAIHFRRDVRMAAIYLLGAIGSEREAVHIRPFLHYGDASLQYAVLSVLGRIGGKGDLDEVNLWLCNPPPMRNQHLIQRVQKCRDELEERLKKQPVPKHLLN